MHFYLISASWISADVDGGLHRTRAKEWIELFIRNEKILTEDSEFWRIFSHFFHFSAFLNEFGHFCTDPWNSDKISSKFRREIAIFMSNLRKFEWIEFWIDSFLPKLWRLFCWNFEIWAVQRYVHLVDLVKRFPTNIYLQKSASIQQRTSLSKFEENE